MLKVGDEMEGMMERDVTMPAVSIRFAKEVFQLVADERQWSTDDTVYKQDLDDFLGKLDAIIKDRS